MTSGGRGYWARRRWALRRGMPFATLIKAPSSLTRVLTPRQLTRDRLEFHPFRASRPRPSLHVYPDPWLSRIRPCFRLATSLRHLILSSPTTSRCDDCVMPVAPQKRHDYINQDIVENQGGIPDVASKDWRRLATLVIMQERDDELHMRRNFFTEGPNKFEQMQCLADRCALCRATAQPRDSPERSAF